MKLGAVGLHRQTFDHEEMQSQAVARHSQRSQARRAPTPEYW